MLFSSALNAPFTVVSVTGRLVAQAAVVQWIGLHPPKVAIGVRIPTAALLGRSYFNATVRNLAFGDIECPVNETLDR